MRLGTALLVVSALTAICAGTSEVFGVETIVVTAPKDLDHAVHAFVQAYAKPTPLIGKMARWSKGSPLCPNAVGLSPAFDIFVTERIRQVAGMVAAPIQTKLPCKPNMVVFFTGKPQALLDVVRAERTDLLGYHSVSQIESMTKVDHPIQAWYATATRDYDGVLRMDDAQAFDDCVALSGLMACSAASTGTRLKDGERSEMAAVTVVVDINKITGLQLGAVADYIAMLALSQTQTFESCLPLASIANLMATGCETNKAPSLTQTDIAYLKALYKVDPDVFGSLQTIEVSQEMRALLSASDGENKH